MFYLKITNFWFSYFLFKFRAHEQFGYCQAGTSGILLDDDTALIGTPGPYTWRGTVFAVSVSDNFLRRDKTLYYGPLTEDESPVDKYSYLGKNANVLLYESSQCPLTLPQNYLPANWSWSFCQQIRENLKFDENSLLWELLEWTALLTPHLFLDWLIDWLFEEFLKNWH